MQKILLNSCFRSVITPEEIKKKFNLSINLNDILQLLKIAVDNVEVDSEVEITTKTWKIIHNNYHVNLAGPVIDILSIKINDSIVEPLSCTRTNDNVMLIFNNFIGNVEVIYNTGYNILNIPICLKNKIINEFFALYEKFHDKNEHLSDSVYFFDKFYFSKSVQNNKAFIL